MLAGLFVLQLLFGGLRGSRLNTVLPLFWVAGAIHLFLRPVPKRLLFIGSVFVLAFLQLYTFYKFNVDVSAVLDGSPEKVAGGGDYSIREVILGDLGRADVQAYMFYKELTDPRDFSYAFGRTYLAAASLLIPQSLLKDRPASKLKEGTDFQWGPGSYAPGLVESRRVYGLGGEAMMNFSFISVPFVYALLGFAVARISHWIRNLDRRDVRLLLAPFAVYLCFSAVSMDSDIMVFTAVKSGLMPVIFILAVGVRSRSGAQHFGAATASRPILATISYK